MNNLKQKLPTLIVVGLFLVYSFTVENIPCDYCDAEPGLYPQCSACEFDGKMTIARAVYLGLTEKRGRV